MRVLSFSKASSLKKIPKILKFLKFLKSLMTQSYTNEIIINIKCIVIVSIPKSISF